MLGWYKPMYLTMTILCSLNDIMTNIYLPLLWNSAMTDFLILVQFFENKTTLYFISTTNLPQTLSIHMNSVS